MCDQQVSDFYKDMTFSSIEPEPDEDILQDILGFVIVRHNSAGDDNTLGVIMWLKTDKIDWEGLSPALAIPC